jgi:hypothetical protein
MSKIRVVFHDNHYGHQFAGDPYDYDAGLYDRVYYTGNRLMGVVILDDIRERIDHVCDVEQELPFLAGEKRPTPCFLVWINNNPVYFERFVMGLVEETANVPENR